MVYQNVYSSDTQDISSFYTPPKRPLPTPLQRHAGANRPSPLIIAKVSSTPAYSHPAYSFSTPPAPAYKSHQNQYKQGQGNPYESASAFFSPCSPGSPSSPSSVVSSPGPITPTRIYMGGIVSPRCSEDEWDEKIGLSIEVPGIVLTEPACPTRVPSPPPKSILLLPPTSLPLPSTDPSSPTSPFYSPYLPSSPHSSFGPGPGRDQRHLYSPAFAAIVHGDSHRHTGVLSGLGVNGLRTVVFGLMVMLGAWHLWLNFQVGQLHGGVIERM